MLEMEYLGHLNIKMVYQYMDFHYKKRHSYEFFIFIMEILIPENAFIYRVTLVVFIWEGLITSGIWLACS